MLKLSYIKPLVTFALKRFNKNLDDHKEIKEEDIKEFDRGEEVFNEAQKKIPDGQSESGLSITGYYPESYRDFVYFMAPKQFRSIKNFQRLELAVLKFWYEVILAIKSNAPRVEIEVVVSESGDVEIKQLIPDYDAGYQELSSENEPVEVPEEEYYGLSISSLLKYAFMILTSSGVFKTVVDYKRSKETVEVSRRKLDRIHLIATPGIGIAKSDLADRMGLTTARLSTDYGVRDSLHKDHAHTGVDFAASEGTPIKSPVNGTVTYIGRGSETAGNFVEVVSDKGLGYRVLHMQEVSVKLGQQVTSGDNLGTVGNTGRSSGAHAHVEVKVNVGKVPVGTSIYQKGVYVNPLYDKYYEDNKSEITMAEATSGIKLSYNNSTTVGTYSNNLMSIQSTEDWLGKTGTYVTSDGRVFTQFDTPEHGLRAGMINLVKYQTKHDVSNSEGQYVTIAEIAQNSKNHSWLSKKYGDTPKNWINAVSMKSGYTPNERIDLRDPETLARVTKGIVFAEHSVTVDSSEVEQIVRHFNIVDGIKTNKQ